MKEHIDYNKKHTAQPIASPEFQMLRFASHLKSGELVVVRGREKPMLDDERSLAKRVREVVNNHPGEHIINVLKAGLATAPFCGGIASLMSDYIPSSKMTRLEQFAEQVAEDLNKLQDRVDANRILTDEFAFVFEKCFRGVAENYQRERLEAFRSILVNSAIGTDLDEDEKEFFLNLVTALSILHIRILQFMAHPSRYLEAHGIPATQIQGGFSDFFPVAIPGVDVEVIKAAFGDLYRYGFITTDKTIFSTMTSGQGLSLLGDRVSELGRRFVEFCTLPG